MCGIAAVLDTSDAVLYICGRYSNGWQISSEERLTVLQVWKLKGIFEFDWELMPVMCRSCRLRVDPYQEWPVAIFVLLVLRYACETEIAVAVGEVEWTGD